MSAPKPKPQRPQKSVNSPSSESSPPKSVTPKSHSITITKEMIATIQSLTNGLSHYEIRTMVTHAESFGSYLNQQNLKTNQVRKFLDAVNRIKVRVLQESSLTDNPQEIFAAIETDIVLLKPKLAYAAARQKAAEPLSEVMAAAIDKVHHPLDFERFVQLVESIIAYHKAEGGQ